MESECLASVRAKIDRAQFHFNKINTALNLVLGTKPETKTVTSKIDSQGKEIVLCIPKAEPIPPTLPLIIGDCVHNLRSALDHLVYQLAVRNGSCPSVFADKIFFPIYLNPSEFNNRPEKLVKPFISGTAFTEIEKSQPYAAYDSPEESDIWILHKLDIIDKHRLLIIAGQKFAAVEFTIDFTTRAPLHQIISEPKWKPMEDGAEILRFQLPALFDSPTEMHVQVHLARTVEFIDTGLCCDGIPVNLALSQMMELVKAIVRDFGKQFFGE
jgi:hypothetical protein